MGAGAPKASRTALGGAALGLVALLAASGGFGGWSGAWRASRAAGADPQSLAAAVADLAAATAAAPLLPSHRRSLRAASDAWIAAVGPAEAALHAPEEAVPRLVFAAALAVADRAAARRVIETMNPLSPRQARELSAADLRDAGVRFADARRCDAATALHEEALRRGAPSALLARECGRCWVLGGDVATGLTILEAAVLRHPSSPWNLVRLGEARLAADDLAGAGTSATRATELAPDLYEAWFLRGKVSRRAGRHDEARQSFARAGSVRPDSPWPRLFHVESLLDAGQIGEADRESAELVATGASYHSWYLRGRVLRATERPHEAIAALDEALARRPQAFGPLLHKAEVLAELEGHAAVAPLTEALVQASPGSARAWLLRGRALRATQQLAGARDAFDRALAIDADLFWARFFKAETLLDLGDAAAAEPLTTEIVALAPDAYAAWYLHARVLRKNHRLGDAVTAFDRALALDATSFWARFFKAETLLDLGQAATAAPITTELVGLAADTYAVWYLHARVLRGSGRLAEALVAFDRALTLDPDSLWAAFFRAETSFDLGQGDAAESATRAIVERSPDFYYGWHLRARVLASLGRRKEAAAGYRRALELRPANRWLQARIDELEAG